MRISRVKIVNFRNFGLFEIHLDTQYIVIVGENNVGKSNLIHALRLVLDHTMSDTERYLNESDFWDGLDQSYGANEIIVTVEFTDFEDNMIEFASIPDCLGEKNGMSVSTVSYIFAPKIGLTFSDPSNLTKDDYEYHYYCDEDKSQKISRRAFQRFITFEVLPALRNAEGDLVSWRRSPLSPMIERLDVDKAELELLGNEVDAVVSKILDLKPIKVLQDNITERIEKMIKQIEPVNPLLGFLDTDPDRLLRFLRLFAEGTYRRNLDEIGMGYANIIYIALLLLNAQQKQEKSEHATMILAVEEPEAHLHPHLQRLVYGDLLSESENAIPVLMTTHSPHIASISPLRSIVMLRKTTEGTTGYNIHNSNLQIRELRDIERYLDVTRTELVFSKSIILVEGIVEVILINEFARQMGYSLDEFGISILSIEGTNFAPYIKLLGLSGFNIPTVVITDGDPYEDNGIIKLKGLQRAVELFEVIYGNTANLVHNLTDDMMIHGLYHHGIFVGQHTLEIDLIDVGYHIEYLRTFRELGEGWNSIRNTKNVFRDWKNYSNKEKKKKIIDKIKRISGKGRFAQRLAPKLRKDKIPLYISEAFKYLGIQ